MNKASKQTSRRKPQATPGKIDATDRRMPEPVRAVPASMDNDRNLVRLKVEAVEATGRDVIITDRQGKTIWANKAMRELTGYAPEEIIGKNPRLFRSGRQPQSFYKRIWNTILSGEEWRGDLINRRKDGGLYVEQMAITPVRNETGEIAYFIAVKQDITSERRVQERMRLLAQAVENSSELIGLGDPEGRLTYVNAALLRTLGCAEKEVIGQNFSVMLSRQNPAALVEEIGKKSYKKGGWSGECLLAGENGKGVPVQASTSPIMDEEGRVVGSVGIARDISERKRVEGRLRESEELFRQLAENIREVFFVRERESARMIYISPAYEELWGRPREELYQRTNAWLDSVLPEDRERALRESQEAGRGAKADFEYRIQRPGGSIRWIRSRTYPVYDEQGRFWRVVGFAEDITERRVAEIESREAHEKLNSVLEETQQRAQVTEKLTDLIDLVQCCQTDEQAYKITEEAMGSIFDSCDGALCLTSPSRDIVETVALWGERVETERAFSPADCWALRRGKIHIVKNEASPLRCPHVHGSLKGGHMCVPLMAQGETLGLLYLQSRNHISEKSDEKSILRLAQQAEMVGERVSLALANLKLREILRHQSVRDPLTGLFNRRYMEETLDREIVRSARRVEAIAVAMCDLDHFKQFNNTFGHEAGDLVLREVSSILQLKIRQGDIACRYGGEEFVLILPEATAAIAAERTEAIRKEVEGLALTYRGHTLGRITISIGTAMFPDDGATAEELVRAADKSLFQAKTEGRDRVVLAWRES